MQATNGAASNDWEEVDVKEVNNLKTENIKSQKNGHLPKEASCV